MQVGTSHLVERDVLLSFLNAVRNADDPSAVFHAARLRPGSRSKRRLREMIPHDLAPAGWDTLPQTLSLAPGEVRVAFTTVEELAGALVALASLLDRELEAFADRYEIRQEPAPEEGRQEVEEMFEELRQTEVTGEGFGQWQLL